MVDIQNYTSFVLAIIAFQLFPGAGTMTILNATASKGVDAGMKSVFGTITGDFLYMLSAVLGLAAILHAYPDVLAAAQWLGVGYLCWMGLGFLFSKGATPKQTIRADRHWNCYRQALAVSMTNPKVILFFMAFFPLFLSKNAGPITLLALMLHVSAISLIYQTGLVMIGNTVARRLSRWKWSRLVASKLLGVVFIGFGVKLAVSIR